MKLDLACGQNKVKGYKGVDVIPAPGVDFVWDLEQYPWVPFKDNSCEEINIAHYLEHVKDFLKFMDEVWRISMNGTIVKILSPYYTSIRAWQDPTHVRAISEATFQYTSKKWRVANKLDHYPMKCDFEVVSMMTYLNEPWNVKSDEAKQFAARHYFNVVSDIYVELKAIK
jgi:predicted SAM-dependent methyltransferase